jgi:hypothetical protein
MASSFGRWLDELRAKRQRWVDASHENNFDRGIWNATVEKYADPTHFIFELLQNAEDTGATWARFLLETGAIVFEHDGRPFNRGDIEGITGIGNTTKLEEANKIGCFGIGFKSVYVVADRPEVHCAIEGMPIAFAIRDLVVPELIPTAHSAPTTRIILPLALDRAAGSLLGTRNALDKSGSRSLLFLKTLTRLEWIDEAGTSTCVVEDGEDGVRSLRSKMRDNPAFSERFVVLTRPVNREADLRHYSVKIALRLNDGGEIVPEPSTTRLAVFFETEDLTGLYFQVHGPFQLTDNRANIKREDPWNTRLIVELSQLLADTLPELRAQDMIKRSFLEVMPNAGDDLPEQWRPMRAAIVAAFQEQDLVPANSGGHVAGRVAVRGPAEIRDFLGDDGLADFGALPDRRWAVGGMRASRAEAFLATLEMREWGYAEFLEAFQRAFGWSWNRNETADAKARSWFDALPDQQVQRFYMLVDTACAAQRNQPFFSHLSFVRIEDGTRVKPGDAFLSPADESEEQEAAAHGLALVRSALTRTGRARGKAIEQFLLKTGVRQISERDYLSAIIRANYSGSATPPTSDRHFQHMRRFLRWHVDTGDHDLFVHAVFLRVEGAVGYRKPENVYLGAPFVENSLSRIYGGKVKGRERLPLWSGYTKLKREELVALTKAVGVEVALTVEETRISRDHPMRGELFSGFGGTRTTSTETNSDYTIRHLSGLLALRDVEVSRMIWKAVSAAGEVCMYAHHAPNQAYECKRALSTLAVSLRKSAWVPAKDGTLRRPSAMTSSELISGFSVVGNSVWLSVIGFGEDQRQQSEEHKARRLAAESIGLPAELADQLHNLPPDALKTLGAELLQRIENGAYSTPQFPERVSPNPERRAQRLATRAQAAPAKSYELRSRSVRTSDKDARQLARPYLRDLYTNASGEMVCQACHLVMPFRLDDGAHYFEAPEFLQSASAELAENHLALCPNCCAKWQNANSATDAELRKALATADVLELSVTLAGHLVRLRFVQVHIEDLRTIFGVLAENSS